MQKGSQVFATIPGFEDVQTYQTQTFISDINKVEILFYTQMKKNGQLLETKHWTVFCNIST